MSDNGLMAVAVLFRCISAVIAVICAYGLIRDGHDGWGWFLFVAVCLGSFNIKTGES
jgi:hypothetical protein